MAKRAASTPKAAKPAGKAATNAAESQIGQRVTRKATNTRGDPQGVFAATRPFKVNNMRVSRTSSGLFSVVVLIASASFSLAQTQKAPQGENALPAARATAPPAYPLVIRIDHIALELLATNKVDEWGLVDNVVLGTHAVGKSHTQGSITGRMTPDRNDASFDIVFQGRTHSTTVGTNGPALIYSHTDTDFVCTRPITFHGAKGLWPLIAGSLPTPTSCTTGSIRREAPWAAD